MKKVFLSSCLIISLAFFASPTDAQIIKRMDPFGISMRSEFYLSFDLKSLERDSLEDLVYVDKIVGDKVYVYLRKDNFYKVINILGMGFDIEMPPSMLRNVKMARSMAEMTTWDSYPDHPTYLQMMNAYQLQFPQLFKLDTIGFSVQGRPILVGKLSDNVNQKEIEPEFFYSSTMHGDETAGYLLCLRLIDHMLNSYGSNAQIDSLMDNAEIWINPLANPDGTYALGDSTIFGATRGNANGYDLNRNFPDPVAGNFPGGVRQSETADMMAFMEAHNFVLSANLHGGAEVMNYPWDNLSQRHADDDWFRKVCRQYVDTAQYYAPNGYMDDLQNGITNGYDWYPINGGRQDYMTFFLRGREVTMEMSNIKLYPESNLPLLWDYNRVALLDYMAQVHNGVRGKVTDIFTNNPLRANITIDNHDMRQSDIFSDSLTGQYFRLLNAGNYSLRFSAVGYFDELLPVNINDFEQITLNVALTPITTEISKNTSLSFEIYPNPGKDNAYITARKQIYEVRMINMYNRKSLVHIANKNSLDIHLNVAELPAGIYWMQVVFADGKTEGLKFLKK